MGKVDIRSWHLRIHDVDPDFPEHVRREVLQQ
jgi:hypothetical protein